MHRINTETATENGMFTDGVPTSGLPATNFNASWCNAVQEEIANLLEGLGVELDENDNSQLFDAVGNFFLGSFENLSAKKITVVDSSDSRYSTTIEPRKTVYKSTATQGTPEVEIDSYFGRVKLTDGDTYSSISADGELKLNSGTIKFDVDGSRFEFDKNVSFSYGEGDEAVYISANSANAYFVVSKGSGPGTRRTAIRATGISTTGTLSVSGTSSFSGNISVAGSANLNVVGGSYFSGTVEFSNANGISFKSSNGYSSSIRMQTSGFLNFSTHSYFNGNVTTGESYSIGGGNSAIVPKFYGVIDSDSVTVTLSDGDFCFVHKNSVSPSSSMNNLIVRDQFGNSVTLMRKNYEQFCAIIYKKNNKLYASLLTPETASY